MIAKLKKDFTAPLLTCLLFQQLVLEIALVQPFWHSILKVKIFKTRDE